MAEGSMNRQQEDFVFTDHAPLELRRRHALKKVGRGPGGAQQDTSTSLQWSRSAGTMKCLPLKSMLLATTIGGFGVAAPAFAQSADSADVAPIVVTARRVEEHLQDVPISITVFNQEQLSNRNVVNAGDLALYTPSLAANTRFGNDGTSFAIRGFSQELRTTASVGTYFADVVSPRGGGSITAGDGAGPGAFFDLQNVQVLKGPQGTLFGRNTTGGAVLLVPQRPTDKFGGYLEGSAGDNGLLGYQAVLNLPITDKARLRLGVDHESRDGFMHNVTDPGLDFEGVNYTAYRASFIANLAPNLENYTIATYTFSNNNGSVNQLFACNPATQLGAICQVQLNAQAAARQNGFYDVASTQNNPRSMINQWQLINATTWDVSDHLTVKNIVSYAELRTKLVSSLFGTNWFTPFGPISFAQADIAPGFSTTSQSTFTEELQLSGRTDNDRLTWRAGLYYEESNPLGRPGSTRAANRIICDMNTLHGDPSAFRCNDLFGLFSQVQGQVTDSFSAIHFKDQAVYGQATYSLNSQLKLTGGLRYTWDDTVGDTQLLAYNFPGALSTTLVPYSSADCADPAASPANQCRERISQHSQAPTWLLDLDYSPSKNLLLYAKYSRGYRQGSVNVAGVSTIDGVSGMNRHGPEQVDAFEVGSKLSFQGSHPGVLDAALFYNDFRNQQIQLGVIPASGSPTTAIVNAGASTIWGLELEGRVELFKGFDLSASYAYLNTNLDKLNVPPIQVCNGSTVQVDCQVGPTSFQGEPLTYSPKNKATVTASYRLPLADNFGHVTLAATYVFVGEQQAVSPTVSPFGILPSYQLVNFNLNWANLGGQPVDASLFVTNAFDEKYTTFVPGLYNGAGFETRNVGEPRMFGVRLRYRFGGDAN
jgi:iron complex outermembrane receptor protein